jgi:uroporphyrinogen-III synthase
LVAWPCYRTEAVPPRELSARLNTLAPWQAAVFAAPSAVNAFAAAWPLPWDFTPIAIGNVTAGALRMAGAQRVTVSAGTGTASLLQAVLHALGTFQERIHPR